MRKQGPGASRRPPVKKSTAKEAAEGGLPIERVLDGSTIADSESLDFESSPYAISVLVKKGHDECGDSAFVFCGKSKIIMALFDGVSGEPGASKASGDAARSILGSLKGKDRISEQDIICALQRADADIRFGFTTALVLSIDRESHGFLIASVGDSAAYSRDSKGAVSLELPMSRAVRDGDSIMRFFSYRNLVSSILGQGRACGSQERPGCDIPILSGKIGKGEAIILASDALADNLFMKTRDGLVTDSSGTEDLRRIIAKDKEPKMIVAKLRAEIKNRIKGGRVDKDGAVLIPKQDDLSIAVISRA